MQTLDKIFVVIDPTTDNQTALATAAWIARKNKDITLHVYEAVFSSGANKDEDALQRVELARHRAWVESLAEPIRETGTEVQVEVEWTSSWREAIAPAAEAVGADLIVKSASAHSGAGRRLLKTSDWTLLRNSTCPVYLIKNEFVETGVNVLVALDIARNDELHSKLNDQVLEFGHALVNSIPDSTLHAVNSYTDPNNFIYQPDLAEKAGIDRVQAHTIEGAPEKVIPEVASMIKADIVVIGTAARAGLKAAMIGNTAEKILDALDTNILTVNAR